jgi:hypothetical protein
MPRRQEDNREGQQVIPVRDKIAEIGINLNTIFTALILAGILWVGTTLKAIESSLAALNTAVALVQYDNDRLRKDMNDHLHDLYAHGRKAK